MRGFVLPLNPPRRQPLRAAALPHGVRGHSSSSAARSPTPWCSSRILAPQRYQRNCARFGRAEFLPDITILLETPTGRTRTRHPVRSGRMASAVDLNWATGYWKNPNGGLGLVERGRRLAGFCRAVLSSVGIHHRALGRLGGFGADIWRRGASHRRLTRSRLEIDRATRPAEIVGAPTPRRDRLAPDDRAGDGCVRGGGADAAAAKQFFRAARVNVSGTTGPAAGRSAGPLGLAVAACGAGSSGIGSATGRPLLPMMRSTSRST